VIHVIVDNYGNHSSGLALWALQRAGGRIKLHLLPPYSPQNNPIERIWRTCMPTSPATTPART
jgi:transposase